jgi:phosphoribosylformylglycinamidine (FGAM) synthase-like enzyme
LDEVALLDNSCWGNPDKPDRLGTLVRALQACYDMAIVYGTPFVSGKDSLFNEYETGEESICIPPTLLISAMGVMTDVNKSVSMDCKQAGNLVYIIGDTYRELGGSHYYAVRGHVGITVPKVNPQRGKKLMDGLAVAMAKGFVKACHDLSEGGIGVAAAEMAFAGGLGMNIDLDKVPLGEPVDRDDFILFSESNTRFLVEVAPVDKERFEKLMAGITVAEIGRVTREKIFEVFGRDGGKVLSAATPELKEAWQKSLRW